MTPRDHAVSYGVQLAEQRRADARILAEYVSHEVNVLRESGYVMGFRFHFVEDCRLTAGDIGRLLAAGSLQSGVYRCEVERDPSTHRPVALFFSEIPEVRSDEEPE